MAEYISTYRQILEAVQMRIRAAQLPDLDDCNVIVDKVNRNRERIIPGIPGIVIAPENAESIPLGGGTNVRDDVGYPVSVSMFDCHRQQSFDGEPACAEEGCVDGTYEFDDRLYWREQIRKIFIRQRLSPIDCVYTCEVEAFQVLNADELLKRNLWSSSLLLRFISRESRGFNA